MPRARRSCSAALMLPFTKPAEYGLGKSGWATAKFDDGTPPPVDMLKEWIDESYRAQAPKKLVAQLDGGQAAPAREKPAAARKANPGVKRKVKPAVKRRARAR